jgi:hypothetical protein
MAAPGAGTDQWANASINQLKLLFYYSKWLKIDCNLFYNNEITM